jgi:hypothetical protein
MSELMSSCRREVSSKFNGAYQSPIVSTKTNHVRWHLLILVCNCHNCAPTLENTASFGQLIKILINYQRGLKRRLSYRSTVKDCPRGAPSQAYLFAKE